MCPWCHRCSSAVAVLAAPVLAGSRRAAGEALPSLLAPSALLRRASSLVGKTAPRPSASCGRLRRPGAGRSLWAAGEALPSRVAGRSLRAAREALPSLLAPLALLRRAASLVGKTARRPSASCGRLRRPGAGRSLRAAREALPSLLAPL